MYRYLQFDVASGRLLGSMSTCELDEKGAPRSPEGRVIVDSEARPEALTAIAYDADTDSFTPALRPRPRRTLTKADVISAMTPEQWAELSRYRPDAELEKHRNADVFWAMSVFTAATRPFAVDDPRVAAVFAKLVTGGAMTSGDAIALQEQLAAMALEV